MLDVVLCADVKGREGVRMFACKITCTCCMHVLTEPMVLMTFTNEFSVLVGDV